MEMSPPAVRARTATVCSEASGTRSPASSLRTCPFFEDRSSQAGTPGRTPMVIWPKPLSTWIEPLETSRSWMLPYAVFAATEPAALAISRSP